MVKDFLCKSQRVLTLLPSLLIKDFSLSLSLACLQPKVHLHPKISDDQQSPDHDNSQVRFAGPRWSSKTAASGFRLNAPDTWPSYLVGSLGNRFTLKSCPCVKCMGFLRPSMKLRSCPGSNVAACDSQNFKRFLYKL